MLAADELNVGRRNAQRFGERDPGGGVGAPVDRGRGHPQLQRVGVDSGECGTARSRHDAYGDEHTTVGRGADDVF